MHQSTHSISNQDHSPRRVWLEPWGDCIDIPPGASYRFVARSTSPGSLDVKQDQDHDVLYAWPGATLEVFDGEVRQMNLDIPVPGLPDGQTMASFVDSMFGGPGGTAGLSAENITDQRPTDELRRAPTNRFRVVGYDQYDYTDYCVGDYDTLDEARKVAQEKASQPNAIPPSFSNIYFVYDDRGKLHGRYTFES